MHRRTMLHGRKSINLADQREHERIPIEAWFEPGLTSVSQCSRSC